MKKTLSIAALVVAGALLAGCSPAEPPAREAHGGISKAVGGEGHAREHHDAIEKSVDAGKKAAEAAKKAADKIAKSTNTITSVSVVEYAMADGPSLIVTVQMVNSEDVTAAALRQAVAESLAQASSAPSQVGLLFVHGEVFVDSQAAAAEVLPGVEFSSGGPTFTGDQARAIVG